MNDKERMNLYVPIADAILCLEPFVIGFLPSFFRRITYGYAFAFDFHKFSCLSQLLFTEISEIAICHPIVARFPKTIFRKTQ